MKKTIFNMHDFVSKWFCFRHVTKKTNLAHKLK